MSVDILFSLLEGEEGKLEETHPGYAGVVKWRARIRAPYQWAVGWRRAPKAQGSSRSMGCRWGLALPLHGSSGLGTQGSTQKKRCVRQGPVVSG